MARVSTPPKKKTSPPKKKTKPSTKTSNKAKSKTKSKSRVNEAGNYTKPELRKRLFEKIKAGTRGGNANQWSARKAQLLALEYKKAGGGYRS